MKLSIPDKLICVGQGFGKHNIFRTYAKLVTQ